jgi:hypothetical protein
MMMAPAPFRAGREPDLVLAARLGRTRTRTDPAAIHPILGPGRREAARTGSGEKPGSDDRRLPASSARRCDRTSGRPPSHRSLRRSAAEPRSSRDRGVCLDMGERRGRVGPSPTPVLPRCVRGGGPERPRLRGEPAMSTGGASTPHPPILYPPPSWPAGPDHRIILWHNADYRIMPTGVRGVDARLGESRVGPLRDAA